MGYCEVCGYVNARMSIAIVRATHFYLRGSRIPTSKMCNRLPQWEDKAGPRLFRRYSSVPLNSHYLHIPPLFHLAQAAHRLGSNSEPCYMLAASFCNRERALAPCDISTCYYILGDLLPLFHHLYINNNNS